MSEQNNENSTIEGEAAAKAGGGKKKLILIALVVVLLAGGGSVYFFFLRNSAAATGDETAEKTKTSDKKTKSKKAKSEDDADEEDISKDDKSSSVTKNSLKSAIPNDENVKQIIELQPFIVNLADSEQARYLRLTVSVGVGGEGGEKEKADPIFVTRVRNAMLAVLSVKSSEEVLSVEGKAKLRKELLKAAQAASDEPSVEAIYITDFIVQL